MAGANPVSALVMMYHCPSEPQVKHLIISESRACLDKSIKPVPGQLSGLPDQFEHLRLFVFRARYQFDNAAVPGVRIKFVEKQVDSILLKVSSERSRGQK